MIFFFLGGKELHKGDLCIVTFKFFPLEKSGFGLNGTCSFRTFFSFFLSFFLVLDIEKKKKVNCIEIQNTLPKTMRIPSHSISS